MQVVGASCGVCGAKIVTAREGRACATCGAVALHDGCATGHVCAGAPKAAPAAAAAPARPNARRSGWIYGMIGGLVASAVVPAYRHWRTERGIAERAAPRLGCTASEIEIEYGPGSAITARGCGTSVSYLRVCGQLERAECLEEAELPPGSR
ncbi:MAG TPA: hypothetical protein VN903_34205 [Polyangia bacterium]|nr:hypothetical protein [Polyangia bacterium]